MSQSCNSSSSEDAAEYYCVQARIPSVRKRILGATQKAPVQGVSNRRALKDVTMSLGTKWQAPILGVSEGGGTRGGCHKGSTKEVQDGPKKRRSTEVQDVPIERISCCIR